MKQVTLQHFLNDKAYSVLSDTAFLEVIHQPSDNLQKWLDGISIHDGYLLSKLDNTDKQIKDCKTYLDDDFAIEMQLNKIHLQDDYPEGLDKQHYLGLYIYICLFLQKFAIRNNIKNELILWYSTDDYNENEEYPSHTVSFAISRTEKNKYPLRSENYRDVFHIGTSISVI